MLKTDNTVLVCIDIQEQLAKAMHGRDRLVAHTRKLIQGMAVLNIPILWTEQNPDRLGSTLPEIAEVMPAVGGDQQRGGWYDVMERSKGPGQDWYRFAFHDRKAWWQQEQGILAYLILHGILKDNQYLRTARESASFYNAFFLDHDDGAQQLLKRRLQHAGHRVGRAACGVGHHDADGAVLRPGESGEGGAECS